MPYFDVKIVREEWLGYWYEYANFRNKPSKEARRLGREGHLGRCFVVKAKDKRAAEQKILADHPGFVAITSDTRKL